MNCFKGISQYIPFMQGQVQRLLRYKFSFFLWMLGDVVQGIILVSLWMAIFNSSSEAVIKGFSRSDMIMYIIISYIVTQIVSVDIEYIISSQIRTGEIALTLIKPISYFKSILFTSLGGTIARIILSAMPIWMVFTGINYFAFGGGLPKITTLILFLISLIQGYILIFLFNFIFSLSAFYLTYIWGLSMLKNALLKLISGELIPLAFFPVGVISVFKYLPFSSFNYVPVMIYMEKYSPDEIIFALIVQVVWIVIMTIIYKILWKKAMKRLTVLGG